MKMIWVFCVFWAAVGWLLAIPFRAEAEECVNYSGLLHWVAGVDTPGNAHDVAVSGSYAYVADGSPGLEVVDVSDPAAPRIAGSVDTSGWAWGVAISGSCAYVADASSGLALRIDPSAALG
jgi:hypothetical protein